MWLDSPLRAKTAPLVIMLRLCLHWYDNCASKGSFVIEGDRKKYKTSRWVEFKLMVFPSRPWPVVDVKGQISHLSEKPSHFPEHGILSHNYWAWVLLLLYTGCVRPHPLLNQYILILKVEGAFILTQTRTSILKSWFINFIVWEAQVFRTFILQTIYCILAFILSGVSGRGVADMMTEQEWN